MSVPATILARLPGMALALVLAGAALPGSAFGQLPYRVPDQHLVLSFKDDNPNRKVAFRDDGLAIEVQGELLMIKHPKIDIEAKLPEPGRFEVEQSNSAAMVEVKNVRVEKTTGKAELVAGFKIFSPTDAYNAARKEAEKVWGPIAEKFEKSVDKMSSQELVDALNKRGEQLPPIRRYKDRKKTEEEYHDRLAKAYVDCLVFDEIPPVLRQELEKIAEKRPAWVTDLQQANWQRAKGRELWQQYIVLLSSEVVDDYLQTLDFGFDSNVSNFEKKLASRLDAVHVVLSGKVGEDAEAAAGVSKALGLKDQETLREKIELKLTCRFYPEVDPKDANAQWFNGQRVACVAREVAAIRVVGRLDPDNHDRVDWWILEGYDPASIIIDAKQDQGFRVERPYLGNPDSPMRVLATGKEAVDYTFEFRPVKPSRGDRKVVVHESPGWAEAAFPF